MSRHLPPLPLARSGHERDALSRVSPQALAELWETASTGVLVLHRGRALMAPDSPTRIDYRSPAALPTVELTVYLGSAHDPHRAFFVATVSDAVAAELPDRWAGLRTVAAELDPLDAGLFTEALAMVNWHAGFGYSPRTGDPTAVEDGGWVRRGPDGADIYPRTDPAVIMRVLDAEDRLLLGRNVASPERFSLLAGFVEPGEALEAAVAREVAEEAGLTIVETEYLGSQPWPFPASLMVGFAARVEGTPVPRPDRVEILELRWFTRAEVSAEGFILPGHASIARAMVDSWVQGGDRG